MSSAPSSHRRQREAFTLTELLVVIAIIAVLAALAQPALDAALQAAKRTQAKNDLVQITTAVAAFFTEYGKYPTNSTGDVTFGESQGNGNQIVLRELIANPRTPAGYNTKQIAFLEPPSAKSLTNPVSGLDGNNEFYDPWGSPYRIAIDGNYNNIVEAPPYQDLQAGYSAADGDRGVRRGVIAWSVGRNGILGGGEPIDRVRFGREGGVPGRFGGSRDIISWQ